MAVCAKGVQQPDGTILLALEPTAQDLSTCAYVVDDGASNAWRELGSMSIENAQQIGTLVGVVWAAAFSFRLIRMAVESYESPEK